MPVLSVIRRGRKWTVRKSMLVGHGSSSKVVLVVSDLGRHPCLVLAQYFPVYKTQTPSHYNSGLRAKLISDIAVAAIQMRKVSCRTNNASDG